MNIVLCEYAEKRKFTAGNKARADVVKILTGIGYMHIPLFRNGNKKVIIIAQIFFACLKTVFWAGKDDIVFVQYPYYPSIVNTVLFGFLKAGRIVKKYQLVLLIHDIVGLRTERDGMKILKKEITLFNSFNKVIVHNEEMAKILKKYGLNANYRILGVFDYLYEGELSDFSHKKLPTVIIAGNLTKEKCGYAYQLSQLNLHFCLYGIDYTAESSENIEYMGAFQPEDLVSHLKGDYGLVWDGDSCETCSGMFGQYLRYNTPHKISLYLAAGLPLIVWKESALADFVVRNNLGICIESLKDLNSVLSGLSIYEYERMLLSVKEYRRDVVSGNHLKAVLN